MLIDTHCHLDDERLYPLAESVISDMAKDGLYCVVTSSSDYESSVCNFALATNNRDVYATVGIHPQEASGRTTAQYDEFCKMAENEKSSQSAKSGLIIITKIPRGKSRKPCLSNKWNSHIFCAFRLFFTSGTRTAIF